MNRTRNRTSLGFKTVRFEMPYPFSYRFSVECGPRANSVDTLESVTEEMRRLEGLLGSTRYDANKKILLCKPSALQSPGTPVALLSSVRATWDTTGSGSPRLIVRTQGWGFLFSFFLLLFYSAPSLEMFLGETSADHQYIAICITLHVIHACLYFLANWWAKDRIRKAVT